MLRFVQVKPPSPETSWKMLAHRAGGFPIPVAFFCYAWSGGVPRDLIRTARACVDVRRRAGRPVKVTELVPPIVRCDIRDALDAVLAGSLEGKSAQKIEALLALRRNIEDRTFSLEDMPQGADVRPENTDGDEDKDHVLMLERLALYMDLGRIIVSYFARDFDKMADGEFEDVVAVVSILARAKFALATYPSETEWLLSQALRVIAEKKK